MGMTLLSLFDGGPVPAVGQQQPAERRGYERAFLENPSEWMVMMFGGGPSATGRAVTPMIAMRSTGTYAAVRVVTEDLGSLPFLFYRRLGDGRAKERATDHPLYSILHDAPNEEMDAMQFVETMQAWAELYPCAYAEIVRNGAGEVTALWPIHPDLVTPLRIAVSGQRAELVYRVQLPAGQLTEEGNNYLLLSRDRCSGSAACPSMLSAAWARWPLRRSRSRSPWPLRSTARDSSATAPTRVAYSSTLASWTRRSTRA
jgi:hypothetical protein